MVSIDVHNNVKILRPPSKIVEHVSFNRTHPNSMEKFTFENPLTFEYTQNIYALNMFVEKLPQNNFVYMYNIYLFWIGILATCPFINARQNK